MPSKINKNHVSSSFSNFILKKYKNLNFSPKIRFFVPFSCFRVPRGKNIYRAHLPSLRKKISKKLH